MIPKLAILVSALPALLAAAPGTCVAVENDRLVARDFAGALPEFGRLEPDTPLAPAPAPGVRRAFHIPELRALAKRYSLDIEPPGDICFEWNLQPLDRARVLEAMRAALFPADARIEIAELSLYKVPNGRIEFPPEGLGRPASAAAESVVTWRGHVVYAGRRHFSVWARVRIAAAVPRVIAAQPLKRGQPIQAGQIRVETIEAFPVSGDYVRTAAEAVDRVPVRDIPEGAELRVGQLAAAPDVTRGDTVDVEVHSGSARLAFTGKAESGGRAGQTVTIRNLASNRLFQARISGKDKVVVDLGRAAGN